jgi:hypothetical protein
MLCACACAFMHLVWKVKSKLGVESVDDREHAAHCLHVPPEEGCSLIFATDLPQDNVCIRGAKQVHEVGCPASHSRERPHYTRPTANAFSIVSREGHMPKAMLHTTESIHRSSHW